MEMVQRQGCKGANIEWQEGKKEAEV